MMCSDAVTSSPCPGVRNRHLRLPSCARHRSLFTQTRERSAGTDATVRLTHALSQYFEAKKMTPEQIAIFVEERKWEYRGRSDDGTRKRS